MQYCYGLSVVNSHLHAGGSIWLTEASVVDPGFWDAFARAGATSFAGVPYTFELLARSGVDWLAQHGLRLVTQAGGRLAPETVRELALRLAGVGHDQGDLAVLERGEVGDQRVEVVPALDEDEPASGTPRGRPVRDAPREIGVAEHHAVDEHGRRVAETGVLEHRCRARAAEEGRTGRGDGHGATVAR
jgi:hypothetical protein